MNLDYIGKVITNLIFHTINHIDDSTEKIVNCLSSEDKKYLSYFSDEIVVFTKKLYKNYTTKQIVSKLHLKHMVVLEIIRRRYRQDVENELYKLFPYDIAKYIINPMCESICDDCGVQTDIFLYGDAWQCYSCYSNWEYYRHKE